MEKGSTSFFAIGVLAAAAAAVIVGMHVLKKRRCAADPALKVTESHAEISDEECRLVRTKNILVILSEGENEEANEEILDLSRKFCGTVVTDLSKLPNFSRKTLFLCGNISEAKTLDFSSAEGVLVITELSFGDFNDLAVVDLGRVPLQVHGVGVFYPRFFDFDLNFFEKISTEHVFQALTESNKPGTAHRTGIYLTPVEEKGDETHFRLLRCSSNLSGPTGNFQATDNRIVGALNEEAANLFENQAPLNHVLAQIYQNKAAANGQKQIKAKIKSHSDKTKDMPKNGLMAFCTFYDRLDRLKPTPGNRFDLGHKGESGMTKLHFRLKRCVAQRPGCNYVPSFSVTLYANSVFFMPLSTNRLYTHEIAPSSLDAGLLPTRLGYVVRCSSTLAVHKQGQTFFRKQQPALVAAAEAKEAAAASEEAQDSGAGGGLAPLEPPTREEMARLRGLYAEENILDSFVDYDTHKFRFSMNKGDYLKPLVDTRSEYEGAMGASCGTSSDGGCGGGGGGGGGTGSGVGPGGADFGGEARAAAAATRGFRSFVLDTDGRNLFGELESPVQFESVGKGRRGTVLVKPRRQREEGAAEGTGGGGGGAGAPEAEFPIVRTTTRYRRPAQCFHPSHDKLAQQIRGVASLAPHELNNALAETYTNEYATMGFHSDQALDLEEGTAVAVFSCYKFPERVVGAAAPPRKLVVEPKELGSGRAFEVPLAHNGVVVFSLDTNRKFKHKIVLDAGSQPPENECLFLTFRTSKTFVKHSAQGATHLADGTQLTLAADHQRREFYKLRKRENEETDFTYPPITYTISESDIGGVSGS